MTTSRTFTRGEMVFDEEGNAYEFVAHIDGVGTVANAWFEYHDSDGAAYDQIGGPVVITGKVFLEMPAPKRATEVERLDEKIAAKRSELMQIEEQLRTTNAARDATLKRIKENEALRRVDDFLAGAITHYVLCGEHSQMDIIAVGDTVGEYAQNGELRLLSLTASMSKSWNSKEGVIQWALNRYSDGSGHNTACVPCTSPEEAMAVLAEKVAERFALWESGKAKNYIQYTAAAAKKYGLPIPQKYADEQAAMQRKSAAEAVANAKRTLSAARAQLAKATLVQEAA